MEWVSEIRKEGWMESGKEVRWKEAKMEWDSEEKEARMEEDRKER